MTQQYPPPYPPPYQQPYHLPHRPPPPSNGIATGGFVVALVGAALSLVPFLGIVSWVISPVGLVLSIVGLTAASRKGGAGRGLAIAGVVLGGLGLLMCFLWVIGLAGAVNDSNARNSGTSYTAPSYAVPSPATGAAAPAGTFS
jgi:hypothetical protein